MPNDVEVLIERALLAYGTLEFYRGWAASAQLEEGAVYKPPDNAQLERYRLASEAATAALRAALLAVPTHQDQGENT